MSSTASSKGYGKLFVQPSFIVAIFIVVAFALFMPTLKMGIWLDECITLNSIAAPDFQSFLSRMYGRLDDLHPPLFYIILYIFVHIFGQNEWLVRIPSIIAGLFLIPATYWLGKTVHSPKIGLVSAFFAAVSPFANYFGCQCRGYSLAALLAALGIAFFCQLVEEKKNSKVTFGACALTLAALCYTEYVGCLLLPALGLAVCLIFLRQAHAGIDVAWTKFFRSASVLGCAALLFVPWLPSVLGQSKIATIMCVKPTIWDWPKVFLFNLLMLTPMPLIIGIPIAILLAAALILAILSRRKDIFREDWRSKLMTSINAVPSPVLILAASVLIPSCVIGYITTWWIGYFRYMYPFSPAGWVLIAIFVCRFLNGRVAKLFLVLGSMFALNLWYLSWFDAKPQSGLRTVAREALAGKYDNCAILLADDGGGPTLGFYLPASERTHHHILVCGFPSWETTLTPAIITEFAKNWGPPEIVDQTERRIAQLPSSGWKYLALVKDSDDQINYMTTKEIPRASRIAALVKRLDDKYKKISAKYFDGVTEKVTVTLYQLKP